MKKVVFVFSFIAIIALAACASKHRGFDKIYPGMTGKQVSELMGTGPSKVVTFKRSYSAWYYGEDRCLLMKGNVVKAKDQSKVENTVESPLGSYEDKQLASCEPPEHKNKKGKSPKKKRKIETPFGTLSR